MAWRVNYAGFVAAPFHRIAFAKELLDFRHLWRGDVQPLGLHVELAVELEIAFVHEYWRASDAM